MVRDHILLWKRTVQSTRVLPRIEVTLMMMVKSEDGGDAGEDGGVNSNIMMMMMI